MPANSDEKCRWYFGETRPDRHQDTAEADQNGHCAPPAYPLPEHGPGKQRYGERCEKPNSGGLVEPEMFERKEIESRRAEQQERAGDLRLELLGLQQAWYGDDAQDRDHGQELTEKSHPYDLSSRKIGCRTQVLRRRVEASKQNPRDTHEADGS